jgi:2-polyprenyl-6-methoxyphenol hydroxylase-like FAD-dependent oxidoreductase
MRVLQQIISESAPELAPRLATANAPQSLRTFIGRPGYVRRSWGSGWALVGDAGHFKDPLTSHGLSDAFRDAELLSHALVGVLVYGDNPRESLAGYQDTRDSLSRDMFEVSDVIAGHRWTDDEIPDHLLRMNAASAVGLDALVAHAPRLAA